MSLSFLKDLIAKYSCLERFNFSFWGPKCLMTSVKSEIQVKIFSFMPSIGGSHEDFSLNRIILISENGGWNLKKYLSFILQPNNEAASNNGIVETFLGTETNLRPFYDKVISGGERTYM